MQQRNINIDVETHMHKQYNLKILGLNKFSSLSLHPIDFSHKDSEATIAMISLMWIQANFKSGRAKHFGNNNSAAMNDALFTLHHSCSAISNLLLSPQISYFVISSLILKDFIVLIASIKWRLLHRKLLNFLPTNLPLFYIFMGMLPSLYPPCFLIHIVNYPLLHFW